MRVLVLDDNPGTLQQIERAMWIWPHRIARAGDVGEAVNMCRHLEPVAIVVAADLPWRGGRHPIAELHDALPGRAILAIGSQSDRLRPAELLELGANAVVTREDLHRPTLHGLLTRLRESVHDRPTETDAPDVQLDVPWRDSRIVGSLICNVRGRVLGANACLARWLRYPSADALLGRRLVGDLLGSNVDWARWQAVAGDTSTTVHDEVFLRAATEQLLWMQVQVFAASNGPTNLQLACVDQTELALLSKADTTDIVSSSSTRGR